MCKHSSAIGSHLRKEIELWSGFPWKLIKKWYAHKEEYVKQFQKLKLGKNGLRPFGSNAALTKKVNVQWGEAARWHECELVPEGDSRVVEVLVR